MKDKYSLRYGQKYWGKRNYDLDPDAFIKLFLDYISSENQVEFGDEDKIEVCRNIVRTSIPGLRSALILNDEDFGLKFRDYMRAFDDKTYNEIKSQRTTEINRLLSVIKKLIAKIEYKISSLDQKNDKIKIRILKIELDHLRGKAKKCNSDLDEPSMLKYVSERDSIFAKINGLVNDNTFYEDEEWLLESIFNVDFDFPLRFLNWISFGCYNKTLNIWKNSQELTKTIESVEEECNPIFEFNSYLSKKLSFIKKRKEILCEINSALRNELYTASNLLIVTQIEGILTDFVRDIDNKTINGKDLRIFVPGSCTEFFCSNNKDKKLKVKSIVHLLLNSDCVKIFDLTLLDYIAKNYYPDRSKIVHGECTPTATVEKVKVNLYLLITIFCYYEKYIDTGELEFS